MTATRLLRSLRDTPTPTPSTGDGNTTPSPATAAASSLSVKDNEWEAWNMSGGLLAWTRHVDPSFPVY
jgi:hypothetical protein